MGVSFPSNTKRVRGDIMTWRGRSSQFSLTRKDKREVIAGWRKGEEGLDICTGFDWAAKGHVTPMGQSANILAGHCSWLEEACLLGDDDRGSVKAI